jgi:hypothetical protein
MKFSKRAIGKVCLAIAMSVSTPLAAFAQSAQDVVRRDATLWQRLYQLACSRSIPERGGYARPLGFYLGSDNMVFRSGYKDLDPRVQADFAYDLYQYEINEGGGWQNFVNAQNRPQSRQGLLADPALAGILPGGQLAPGDNPDTTHVSYDKEQAFAEAWWQANSPAYRSSLFTPQYWWRNDAVLDANDLFMHYETQAFHGGASQVSWMEGELDRVFKKS